MNKYLKFFQLNIATALEYRADFLIRRIRNLIGYITMFLIWIAVFDSTTQVAGYTKATMFTYVFASNLFNAITWSNWSGNFQGLISSGDLSNFLLKPLNVFSYGLSQELADKLVDLFFTMIELSILYLIFRPPLDLILNFQTWLIFILFIPLVAILRYLVSMAISFTTFWYYQNGGWGQRFFIDVMLDLLSGQYFPLDILPISITLGVLSLPTSLFVFTPMQVFLGRISLGETMVALGLLIIWIVLFYWLDVWLWKKGLKTYGAFGR